MPTKPPLPPGAKLPPRPGPPLCAAPPPPRRRIDFGPPPFQDTERETGKTNRELAGAQAIMGVYDPAPPLRKFEIVELVQSFDQLELEDDRRLVLTLIARLARRR